MRTVGVLGANGFVGSRIVEKFLLERTARVVPIVRSHASLARVARFAIEPRMADSRDEAALTKAFEGCDVVVHATLGRYNQIVAEPPVAYRAAEKAGVRRIVHISTASVHGQNPEPGTDETSALRTDQPVHYNNAKVKAEQQFRALRRRGRVELVTLRPGIIFGPRDVWVSGIARRLTSGQAYLVDGGHGICNTTYIDNLVHAIALSLEANVDGEVFLIGDCGAITWADLHHWIRLALPDTVPPKILMDPAVIPESRPLLDRVRGPGLLRSVLRVVPKAAKTFARTRLEIGQGMIKGGRATQAEMRRTDWVLPDTGPTQVPIETALLHRCRYKFPFARARGRLGYEPPVPLAEGLIRSIHALRFAGFEIDPAFEEPLRKAYARMAAKGAASDHAPADEPIAASIGTAAPTLA